MAIAMAALGGFLLGCIGGYVTVMLIYVLFTVITGYHDFEGATSMGIAFGVAPLAALLTGIACAVFLARRALTKRRARASAADTASAGPGPSS